jgi:AcrR family transcriptional regulator
MYPNVKTGSGEDEAVPVKRLTPNDRRELTRATLVEAAAEVFAEKGFYGASLEEIAEVAGFTRGAIYSNFGNKEELLYAVIDHFIDGQLQDFAATMDADVGDPVDDARAAAGIFGRGMGQSRTITALELELRLAALRDPEVRRRLAQLERETSMKAARLVEEQVVRHGLTLDISPRDLADIGRAAVEGLMQLAWIDEEDAERYEHLVESVFVLLARSAVGSEDEAPPRKGRKTSGRS